MSDLTRRKQLRNQARRRAGLAAGTWRPRLAADVAREHVARLRRYGLSADAIATAAGLSLSAVSALCWDKPSAPRAYVQPSTIDALASVRSPLQAPDGALIAADGTRRRIQALQTLGWSQAHLAARLGVTTQAVSAMKRAERVSVANARRIAALYDELSMRLGPDAKTRTWAARLGYAPPLAWDDETIDDPAATPDLGRRERGADLDEWLWLVRNGEHPERAARRLGVTLSAIEKAAIRHDRRDVLDRVYATGRRAS